METRPQRVIIYRDGRGREPFKDWVNSLARAAHAAVIARLNRLEHGNFGDCISLRGGVFEFRIHKSPGYRIYYGRDGNTLVILLCGGEKGTQQKDIAKAKRYWRNYKEAR